MKKIYTLAIASLMSTFLFAQNYLITDSHSGSTINGQTIDLWFDASVAVETYDFDFKNNTTSNKRMMMKRQEISIVGGTDNYFCWAQCYAPPVTVSLEAIGLAPQQIFNLSSVDYRPFNNIGLSTIRYIMYDSTNVNDSVWFTVNWHGSATGVTESNFNYTFSNAYPSPAVNNVSFNYTINSTENVYLTLVNVLGTEVKKIELANSGGVATLNVSDLPAGLYFCSLVNNNKTVITRKFTVVK